MSRLRLATRSSAQARTQTEAVAAALTAAHPGLTAELIFVETLGDLRGDVPLHQLGGQGIFVKAVQRAVLAGHADVAVHSAKDLPSQTADGLVIGAFTARRDPRDVLVGRALDTLASGATVATGSVRRRAQLALLRPDLRFAELRGNIATRLSKVPDGGAIVMALAALQVLGIEEQVAEVLDVAQMVPMVGQGCVAVECGADDVPTIELLAAVDHPGTRADVEVERAFLAELGAGCSMPVGAHVVGNVLHTFLADPDSGRHVRRVTDLGGPAAPERDVPVAAALARESAGELQG